MKENFCEHSFWNDQIIDLFKVFLLIGTEVQLSDAST